MNQCLTHLSMVQCSLEEKAGESIKSGLIRNTVLKYLNLKTNNIYDEGFSAICEALLSNTTLTYLNVTDNNIKDKGGFSLASMLKRNKTLKEIFLVGNSITDESAPELVEGVMNNKVLKKIRLKMNPISFKYIDEIASILKAQAQRKIKNLQPKINKVIRQLKSFEEKKEVVFEKLRILQAELESQQLILKQTKKEINDKELEEMGKSNVYDTRLSNIIRTYSLLEEEKYYLEKEDIAYRKTIRKQLRKTRNEEQKLNDDFVELREQTTKLRELKQVILNRNIAKTDDLNLAILEVKAKIDNVDFLIARNQHKYDEKTGKKKQIQIEVELPSIKKLKSMKSKEEVISLENQKLKRSKTRKKRGKRKNRRKGRGKSKKTK